MCCFVDLTVWCGLVSLSLAVDLYPNILSLFLSFDIAWCGLDFFYRGERKNKIPAKTLRYSHLNIFGFCPSFNVQEFIRHFALQLPKFDTFFNNYMYAYMCVYTLTHPKFLEGFHQMLLVSDSRLSRGKGHVKDTSQLNTTCLHLLAVFPAPG